MGTQDNLLMINQAENTRIINSEAINASRSRAKVKLTEWSQQLQAAEKRVNGIHDRLRYCKMLYQSAGPAGGLKTSMDMPIDPLINPVVFSNRERRKIEPEMNNNTLEYANKFTNKQPIAAMTVEKNSVNTARSNKMKLIDYLATTKEETLKNMLYQEERAIKRYREKVPETTLVSSSNSSEDTDEILEPLEIFKSSPTAGKTNKKSELILKITSARGSNKNKIKKIDKTPGKASLRLANADKPEGNNKTYERLSRLARIKKSKLRIVKKINSKAMSSSKHNAVDIEIKSMKKIKRRVNRVKEITKLELNYDDKNTEEIVEKSNEVVEIYHNDAANNTTASAVSSKQHFKLELAENNNTKQNKEVQNIPRQTANFNKKDQIKPQEEEAEKEREEIHVEMGQKHYDAGDQVTSTRRKENIEVFEVDNCNTNCQSAPVRSWHCDSFPVRSYEQPTISSKLKRVNRCYLAPICFNLKNMRNIPFVVGTSVTPTHNLGLNIQQTLSLMRHQQPGITPDLPSVLGHKIIDDFDNPMFPVTEEIDQGDHVYEAPHLLGQINEMSEELTNLPNGSVTATRSTLLRQRETELQSANNQFQRNSPKNSSYIKNVIMRLHDQVEAMNKLVAMNSRL